MVHQSGSPREGNLGLGGRMSAELQGEAPGMGVGPPGVSLCPRESKTE